MYLISRYVMKKILLASNIENRIAIVFLSALILVVPFVYTQTTIDPALVPRHLALNILLFLYGAYCLYVYIKNKNIVDSRVFTLGFFKIYIVFLLIAAISIIFALNKSEAIYEWFKLMTFFTLLCLLSTALLNGKMKYVFLTRLIILYSIVISLWGFYELILISSFGELDHQSSYFIRALSSNRNLYAQILLLTFSFNLFGVYIFKRGWRALSIVSSIFIVVLLTVLLTRSVWIAFVLSFFFSLFIWFMFHKRFFLNRKAIRLIIIVVVVGFFIVVSGIILYSRLGNAEVFKKQTYWISDYKYGGSSVERIDIWQNTLKMIIDNPVTGVGQGNWRITFPAYGLTDLRSETGEIFFQRPHNDFLWVWAENGIMGIVFFLSLFVLAYYYLFRVIIRSPQIELKYLALAMIFGLSAYLIISFFSFPKERIEHQIYLHLIFAVGISEYYKLNPKQKNPGKGQMVPVFIVVLILLTSGCYLTLSRYNSEKHIAKAYNFRNQGNWKSEIKEYRKAKSFITKVDAFSTPLSWYIGEAWYNLNELDSAHFYFRKAYGVNPYHLHVLNNLGTTYELKGNSNKAEELYKEAHNIAPRFEDPLFNLCALYYNTGKYNLAYENIRKIDINTKNPKYTKFLTAILWHKIDKHSQEISDRLISKSIMRIRNDDDWIQKVHIQSVENEINFDKQLLLEVIYLLESIDSTITSDEADAYKEKYNLQ